jgi:hypothetical protein
MIKVNPHSPAYVLHEPVSVSFIGPRTFKQKSVLLTSLNYIGNNISSGMKLVTIKISVC